MPAPLRRLSFLALPILLALGIAGFGIDAALQRLDPVPPALAEDITPDDQAAFEARVRAFLIEHPEVIVEALQELDRRQKVAADLQQQQAITAQRERLTADPDDPIAGNPDGGVIVVEFFDYRCPYCKSVAQDMIDTLEAEGDVRVVFKEYPILGPDSVYAARAALAANRQGQYLPFHAALMNHKGALDRAAVLAVAAGVGIDTDLLEADMERPEVAAILDRNMALGAALQIGGTPAFVVGDTLVPGAVDMNTLRDLVAKARNG